MVTYLDPSYHTLFFDDGLPLSAAQKRYRKRREVLANAVGQVCVIFGVTDSPDNRYSWSFLPCTVDQDPFFLYLTGINQYRCAIVLDPTGNEYRECLFLGEKDGFKEFWEGIALGVGSSESENEVKSITGFDHVDNYQYLVTYASQALKKSSSPKLGVYWIESSKGVDFKDTHLRNKQVLTRSLKRTYPKLDVFSVCSYEWAQRLIMDDQDLSTMATACRHASDAFTELLSSITACRSEVDAAALLDGAIASKGWFRNSFPSIVAAGKNACVLHYRSNNMTFEGNELLLLDFGVRQYGMNSDISRTIPVNGVFNPLQKLLYSIVLDTQLHVEQFIKAGVTIDELNQRCWDFMEDALRTRFIDEGGIMERPYKRAPHNVGHLLGHQVHDGDPFRDYRSTPLKEGMIITNEPGLYGIFELTLDGTHYKEAIGIRIEDDILVQKDGFVNLTSECPKHIDELERLIAKG